MLGLHGLALGSQTVQDLEVVDVEGRREGIKELGLRVVRVREGMRSAGRDYGTLR